MIELADATSRSEDCWNRIGVRGDHSCPELKQFVHCQNCPVFASAGRRLFAQRPPSGYAEEMLAGLTQAEPAAPSGALHSVLVFRIGEEWLALAVSVLVEVTPAFPVHSVPQRSGLLAGVVNIRGELQLCVRLDRLLGIALNSDLPAATLAVKSTRNAMSGSDRAGLHRFVVVQYGPERWVFPVDEVDQVARVATGQLTPVPATVARSGKVMTRGIFRWNDRPTGFLDEARVFQSLGARLSYERRATVFAL